MGLTDTALLRTKWIGCAAANFRAGRNGIKPEAIVIHIADGSLASVDAWFGNPAARVSAHYCVGKRGEIHQFVREEDTAFHAGNPVNPVWTGLKAGVNPNLYTIGIEHEGRAEDGWTDAMYQASALLVSEIAARWRIPLDAEHIVLHREIRANKVCPGTQFDREKLLGLARGAGKLAN
jgi:N-acetyl-anhydromuramyl-L-alanine amidase AmpD